MSPATVGAPILGGGTPLEPICDIEVVRQGDTFVAKIRFDEERAPREYRSQHIEGILEQVAATLQDRFEELLLWQ